MTGHPSYPPTEPAALPPGAGMPRRTGLAVAALVLGLLGFCMPPLGLLGLIFGIVAVVKASNRPEEYGGKGLAIAGICTGGVSQVFLVVALLISIMLPSLARARELARRTVCAANIRQIDTALNSYASGNQGAFPPDLDLLVDTGAIAPGSLQCPTAGVSNYVYLPDNAGSSDPRQVVLFEPLTNHDGEGGVLLFADGHVEFVPASTWEELIGFPREPPE